MIRCAKQVLHHNNNHNVDNVHDDDDDDVHVCVYVCARVCVCMCVRVRYILACKLYVVDVSKNEWCIRLYCLSAVCSFVEYQSIELAGDLSE